jgi:hypothetical protein
MFKRFSIHLALIFLFAFAQIGAVTHSISHVNDEAKHNKTSHSQQNSSKQDPSKQDSSTHSEQCTQCLSFAQIASGAQAQCFSWQRQNLPPQPFSSLVTLHALTLPTQPAHHLK